MTSKTSFTYKLDKAQQAELTHLLKYGNYRPVPKEHTIIAVEMEKCNVALYKSGKCLIQGKGAEDFVTFTLEPQILKTVAVGYEDIINPEASDPHMGIDESGKGDFFGPMVIASAYVDSTLVKMMREMDVKDSKKITSDKKALALGRDLRALLGKRFSIIKIGPGTYNRLYSQMRNVNSMLGWAHARAIENMLEVVPNCPRAISDQFGKESVIKSALMKKGKKIELVQKHHAESDMAVAAASIIAREGFLRGLKEMENKYEIDIPKGASAAVKEVAIKLAQKHGPQVLLDTVKCHFKTTDAVLTAIGQDRSALGREGQAVSRTIGKWTRKK